MFDLLAQATQPTTQPTAETYLTPLSVPIIVGLLVALGPLLTAFITWRYQAKALLFKTYLEGFKAAKDAGVLMPSEAFAAHLAVRHARNDILREARLESYGILSGTIIAVNLVCYYLAVSFPFISELQRIFNACLIGYLAAFAFRDAFQWILKKTHKPNIHDAIDKLEGAFVDWYKLHNDPIYRDALIAKMKAEQEQATDSTTKTKAVEKPPTP